MTLKSSTHAHADEMESEMMAFGCVDHMESKDDETKTRYGLTVNHVKGYVSNGEEVK